MTQKNTGPIKTGIAGLGRSGWGIHYNALKNLTDKYEIAAVFDTDPARLAESAQEIGCKAYDDYDKMLADDNIELVIVATPNHLHAECSIKALEAGKDAVCEKPMAVDSTEADKMIEAARRTGNMLTIFQNRRYEADFQKIREVVNSGVLGRIVEIKISAQKFGRRWDWQTLKKYGGGDLSNNGPHKLDQALDLLGDVEPEVWCHLDNALSLGDAEDHVKVILRTPDGKIVDMELTSACAYPQDKWNIMGTQGGLRHGPNGLEWKYIDPAELLEREVDETPTTDRSYNREELNWKEDKWEGPEVKKSIAEEFYHELFETIRKGAPLRIDPVVVRRQIAIIEECKRQSPLYSDQ